MRLIELHLRNLNSLRTEASIRFLEAPLGNTGLFAIVGDTGAGKSTILDAITLALYGRTPRHGDKQPEVLSNGAADAYAQAVFEAGGQRYLAEWSIRRSRGKADGTLQAPKRKLSQYDPAVGQFVSIAEKAAEINAQISEITGLDYDRFLRSALLAQGEFAAFLKAKAQERSELLERITGLEIYTQLSREAFLRHKREEEVLRDIDQRRLNLKLLSPEEREKIEQAQERLKAETDALRTSLNRLDALLNRLAAIGDLEEQFAQQEAAAQALEEGRAAMQADVLRLERRRRAETFQPALEKLQTTENQLIELKVRAQKLDEQLAGRSATLALTEAEAETLQTSIAAQKKDLPVLLERLEQARILDRETEAAHKRIDRQGQDLQAGEEELGKRRLALAQTRSDLADLEEELETIRSWHQGHAHLQTLAADWALLSRTAEDYQGTLSKIQEQEKRLAEKSGLWKKESERLPSLTKQLQTLQGAIAQSQESLKTLRPDLFSLSRSALAHLQNQELEIWSRKQEILARLEELHQDYLKLLQEQNEHIEKLSHLQSLESRLQQSLLSAMEETEAQYEALQFKQSIYQQQIRIANYQKDRQELKEGDPCPLCFSVHHPFREHPDVETFEDKAEKEFLAAQKRHEKLLATQRKFMHELGELEAKAEQIRGNEEKNIQGLLGRQNRKLEEQEIKMRELLTGFEDRDMLSEPGFRRERQSWYREQLEQRRQNWDQILQISGRLEQEEKEEAALRDQHRILEFRVKELLKEREQAETSLAELRALQVNREEELSSYFTRYQMSFSLDHLDRLRVLKGEYQEKNERGAQLEQERIALSEKAKTLSERFEEKSDALALARETYEKETAELASQKNLRFELAGSLDPHSERERLEEGVRSQEERMNELLLNKASLGAEIRSLQGEIERTDEQKSRLEEDIQRQNAQVASRLQSAGFDSAESALAALLPLEEAEKIAKAQVQFQKRETEIQHALSMLRKKWEEEKALLPEAPDPAALRAERDEAGTSLEGKQMQLGALLAQLEDSRRREREALDLDHNIQKQKKELLRWKVLNDLIGAHDGKKFRTFAQGLTLERLVFLANEHLGRLNGRYLIRKMPGEELDLEIIDTYQANHTRSMQTLSGGESFLVSLALALGLSELAGQRSDIRSLFIDEGFGALDEAALDMALSTLENLQAKGKTIGVISHVKELKERIAAQIQVVKRSNGFSEIEMQG